MVEFKINVANSNLARKINFLYNGKLKRSPRRTRSIQKCPQNKKSHGKKAMVPRLCSNNILHLPNILHKTILVYFRRKQNDSKIKRTIVQKTFSEINTTC